MERHDIATVIECAQLAPSVHNTQPWSFAVTANVIEVRADRQRGLPVLDPNGRELLISCGAAVEFAQLAVRGQGWDCTLQVLPDDNDPDLMATLTIGDTRPVSDHDLELVDAIPRRYTDRGNYDTIEIAPDLVSELAREVGVRGGWLRVLDHEGDRLAAIQALSSAESAEAADPAYRAELANWLRVGHSVDGIPAAALVDSEDAGRITDVPARDFTGHNEHRHPGDPGPLPTVERDTLLMIGTATDEPRDWLNAGRAMGWLLLRLTVAGLSAQPLGQVLDIESSRQRLARQIGVLGHVEFLLRVGVGHGRPSTGRRDASISA